MRQSGGQISRLGTLKSLIQRFAFLSLVGLTFVLMLIGKADSVLVERARIAITDAVVPILRVLSEPASTVAQAVANVRELVAIREQNAELRDANLKLLEWQALAQKLEAENQSLKALLSSVAEPAESSVTARVVADTGGSFAQSVLILAGTSNGAGKGDVVLTGEGLVGRITQAGARASRVLLLTDINSRIPVFVGDAATQAILAGDNSLRPKLLYTSGAAPILVGDKVVTSGDGDAFPTGLPVGRVARIKDGVVEVEPYVARDQLRQVKIADYGLGGVLGEFTRKR